MTTRAPRSLVLSACCLLLQCGLTLGQKPLYLKPPIPGQLIELGGYKLHFWCMGEGSPTVVLSSGSGDFSFDWALVQPEVSKAVRVCSYDRGGEAWSDLGPSPLTGAQEAFDLRRMLRAAAIKPPYILVGHSLGGLVAQIFASRYPLDVSGLVLVDASNWNSMLNIDGKTAPMRALSKNRTIPAPRSRVTQGDRLSADAIKKIQEFVKQFDIKPRIEPPYDKLPPTQQNWRLWALSPPSHWAATQNDYLGEEAELLYKWTERTTMPLANMPLIVLSRVTPQNPTENEKDHETHQRELEKLSSRGELIFVPESGHHIQLDQPRAVISAIQRILGEVSKNPR